ncbi:MAG TPA: hypothetical protein VHC19_15485 [Pirellulales bacterium]|jgi:hypothetical protein|nr:hypothetical protein [Pirellulales bacterium]
MLDRLRLASDLAHFELVCRAAPRLFSIKRLSPPRLLGIFS